MAQDLGITLKAAFIILDASWEARDVLHNNDAALGDNE